MHGKYVKYIVGRVNFHGNRLTCQMFLCLCVMFPLDKRRRGVRFHLGRLYSCDAIGDISGTDVLSFDAMLDGYSALLMFVSYTNAVVMTTGKPS